MCGYNLIYRGTFIHTYYECQNHCVQVSDPLSLPTDLLSLFYTKTAGIFHPYHSWRKFIAT